MKTLNLLKKYNKLLLSEQEPGGEVPPVAPTSPDLTAAQTPETPPEQPLDEPQQVDKRKQSLALALSLAFIFSPKKVGREEEVNSRVKRMEETSNVLIPDIIDTIGDIVCMDVNLCRRFKQAFPGPQVSLKKESKTIALLNRYTVLHEQELDATEPRVDDSQKQQDVTGESEADVQKDKADTKLSLDEVFPLYRNLLSRSVLYEPTSDELFMIDQIVNQFLETDPDQVIESIKNVLRISSKDEDDKLEQDLSEL